MNVGEWIFDLFGSDGAAGLLLVIFLIFLLDAFVVPTLPELFFVLAYLANTDNAYGSDALWGCDLLLMAVLAETIGIMSLYCVVKRVRIPKRMERLVGTYTGFLVLGDERLLLLNRVAPMIPFAGAFIAIAKWDIRRSLAYVIAGCIAKYGSIALLSDFFKGFFGSDQAQLFTIVMIFAVIGISMALSFILKRRHGIGEGGARRPGPGPLCKPTAQGPATPNRDGWITGPIRVGERNNISYGNIRKKRLQWCKCPVRLLS
ncbi:hypothetical protein PAA26_05020 [Methanomassiliicoccaceae archaeon COG_1]|nr:hypothetical protein [Methanomassiliicoccaceae archaeon COG_1]